MVRVGGRGLVVGLVVVVGLDVGLLGGFDGDLVGVSVGVDVTLGDALVPDVVRLGGCGPPPDEQAARRSTQARAVARKDARRAERWRGTGVLPWSEPVRSG